MEISHLMYGKYGIPPCLGLGRKNPNQSVIGLFKVCFEVGLFLVE